mgnify:CR=1 FL=1|tara:strand:- start:329 stop:898 length:570 start_codon:yes stop_codon:yes gene_type:complete
MAFWKQNDVVPKRKFRFKLTIAGTVAWWAKDVKVPTFSVGEHQHSYLDNVYKFPGKVIWDDVTCTLVDPAGGNDVIRTTMQILIGGGYDVKDKGEYETISKERFGGSAQNSSPSLGFPGFKIEIIDEEGTTIETWTLNNPFLKSVDFDTMAYESEDLRNVQLTIAYDWATCEIPGASTTTTPSSPFLPR